MPEADALQQRIAEGYRFIAYSIDSVLLHSATRFTMIMSDKD
jgi:hypothetical protein